jgi:Toxin SymE, type I toxin-antitoxin system
MAGSHSIRKSVRVADSAAAIASANPLKDPSNGSIGDVSQGYCPAAPISPSPARNARTAIALPRLRRCTMGYLIPYVRSNSAYPTALRLKPEPPRVPFLRLQGRWLHQAGFAIGAPVRVLVMPGRLMLEVDREAE